MKTVGEGWAPSAHWMVAETQDTFLEMSLGGDGRGQGPLCLKGYEKVPLPLPSPFFHFSFLSSPSPAPVSF